MKKMISTYGLLSGTFDDSWIGTAIHERIDNKLVYCYKQNNRDDIRVVPTFTYEVDDGLVFAIELSYAIDNPTPQRLEYFRETCEYFFELHGFAIDSENESPRVYFRATDMFDMASLIHALEFLSVSMERIICVVDSEHPEKNVHYGKTLINEEGKDDNEDEEDNNDEDDMPIFDEHDVGYSKDGKKLVCCRYTFNDTRYEVPDGVEEIADFAFLSCRHFVELSIPRSVRIIGDYIFGNGGQIVIRD